MRCYPAVPFIVCDNLEAHALAHIRFPTIKRPCRFCNAEKFDLHKFEPISREQLRSYEDLRRNMQSKDWCFNHSIQLDIRKVALNINPLKSFNTCPIQSCIFSHFAAFGNNFQHYFSVLPPDLLHTVHAGIVRFSVCWSLSILKVNSRVSVIFLLSMTVRIKRTCKTPKPTLNRLHNDIETLNVGSAVDSEFKLSLPAKARNSVFLL